MQEPLAFEGFFSDFIVLRGCAAAATDDNDVDGIFFLPDRDLSLGLVFGFSFISHRFHISSSLQELER